MDANELLMSGGIKGIKWKDNPVGYTVIGTIVDPPKAEQMTKYESTELDFWPSGDPKMQIVVTIQTELHDPSDQHDDGKRKLHIPPRMMQPVREAIKRVGGPGLEVGGRIAVRRTGGTGATGSPFEFAAEYARPALDPGSLMADTGNGASPAAQAPPAATQATAQPQGLGLTQPTQTAQAAPPVSAAAQSLGLTSPATPVDDTPPPGIAPEVWAGLPDMQKAAIKAAMAPAGGPGY